MDCKISYGGLHPKVQTINLSYTHFYPKKMKPFISYVPGSFENLMEQNNCL